VFEPDWAPSVDDVGAVLRARTKDENGNELGTFTDATRPTAVQVNPLIDTATADILAEVGTVPDKVQDNARRVAAIGAALLVELTFFPEQIGTGRSPYTQLKEWYDDKLKRLVAQVTELQDGGARLSRRLDAGVLVPARLRCRCRCFVVVPVMPLVVSFEIFGDVQVERELLNIKRRADGMRPAFEKLHQSFVGIERRQFDSQGRSGSGGWAPLKPATIAAKQRRGHDARILRATERLRKSLTNKTSADHVKEISLDGFFFGTRVPHARFHQTGTTKMPQRRPVELTERERRAWVRVLQRHIREGA
jgi:phage gpG-like protein